MSLVFDIFPSPFVPSPSLQLRVALCFRSLQLFQLVSIISPHSLAQAHLAGFILGTSQWRSVFCSLKLAQLFNKVRKRWQVVTATCDGGAEIVAPNQTTSPLLGSFQWAFSCGNTLFLFFACFHSVSVHFPSIFLSVSSFIALSCCPQLIALNFFFSLEESSCLLWVRGAKGNPFNWGLKKNTII